MSKRSLSPAPLPPSKRLHTLSPSEPPHSLPALGFDSTFYDEVILQIFSHLPYTDLCSIQTINKNWSRLSLDNQLWKALYLKEYGRTRLRGGRGFIGRGDGREVRPLPGRAVVKGEEGKDWKWMFRISSNWRTGRCSVEHLHDRVTSKSSAAGLESSSTDQIHVVLAGNLIITTSSNATSPTITILTPNKQTHTLPAGSSRYNGPTHITALSLDQSPPSSSHHSRLACFLSTGEFCMFSINHQSPTSSLRTLTYVPTSKNDRTSPIIHAVYHQPLLITLSKSFHLSIYDLSSNTVRHTQTLTSFTSFPPSSLVLSTPSPTTYKLVLAYAIPVYPAHWSVGATELIISGQRSDSDSDSSDSGGPLPVSSMMVTGTRTIRAFDIPPGWIDEQKLRSMREQWGRKVSRVADTQTDGKWVVLAPDDPHVPSHSASTSAPASPSLYTSSPYRSPTTLQLYRLHLPSSSSSSSPKLNFVRNLYGQDGPVEALALADGRCVSLGVNGSIWAWDLEVGMGTEVAPARDWKEALSDKGWTEMGGGEGRGKVVFDERRVVSSGGGRVEVRRFDV
ncbi:hypothetical protein JAAARDRAFT_194030 [Jaapia argillacea MUCL 33604]|uniref:F-box domain-containing protein n=1 Tax=Jaapia argillacea MUCL 33604 TaxID=933084 RepID=A0A067Q2M7_9AGAM|nr:hypothetical protein JAAARDRAFT_194030 [Jaapia argillacea MUCL 33604]